MSCYRRGDVVIFSAPESCGTDPNTADTILKKRPWLVVSNDKANACSSNVVVVPLTSKVKRLDLPTHILLPTCGVLRVPSTALCEQLRTYIVDESCWKYVGTLPAGIMSQVDRALCNVFWVEN